MTYTIFRKRSVINLSRTAVAALLILSVSQALSGCKRATGPDRPAAPHSLRFMATSTSSIDITWIDASDNETGFVVEMDSPATAGFSEVATVAAGVTTFSVTGLDPDDNNSYRVYAVNSAGSSEPSPGRRFRIYGVTLGHVVEDFTARDQGNNQVSLYNYQGNIILLNFAASW